MVMDYWFCRSWCKNSWSLSREGFLLEHFLLHHHMLELLHELQGDFFATVVRPVRKWYVSNALKFNQGVTSAAYVQSFN